MAYGHVFQVLCRKNVQALKTAAGRLFDFLDTGIKNIPVLPRREFRLPFHDNSKPNAHG